MIRVRRVPRVLLSRRYQIEYEPRDTSQGAWNFESVSRGRAAQALLPIVGIGDAGAFVLAADRGWASGSTGWAVEYEEHRPSSAWLRIELEADDDAPFVAMFEPTGVTYNLAGGERMYADITKKEMAELRIVNWKGGVSVWAPGPVVTRDSHGNELHQL